MSMTPDQILQLQTFGKIPAETAIDDVRTAFNDDCITGTIEAMNYTVSIPCTTTASYYYCDAIDCSSFLSKFLENGNTCYVKIIVMAHAHGSFNFACKYTTGADTSVTTKTQSNGPDADFDGDLGGAVFGWTAISSNIARNGVFQVGVKGFTQSISARITMLCFSRKVAA